MEAESGQEPQGSQGGAVQTEPAGAQQVPWGMAGLQAEGPGARADGLGPAGEGGDEPLKADLQPRGSTGAASTVPVSGVNRRVPTVLGRGRMH